MSYKIAVASSDGSAIDLHFGAAHEFDIYEVKEGVYTLLEKRTVPEESKTWASVENQGCREEGCGAGEVSGCGGSSGGCGSGANAISPKVDQLSDCRCIVCEKIGPRIQKQFERRAITVFDVSCTVEEALNKITSYYERVDNHQSLKGLPNN